MINKNKYNYKSWYQMYTNGEVDISKLSIHRSWKDLFKCEIDKPYWNKINEYISKRVKKRGTNCKIYPYPNLLFNAFNTTPLDKIKVVILGQDPYHDCIEYNGTIVPQAMGLSFSVPVGIAIPSSLNNIYENMLKYKQIVFKPTHGNLESWAYQGCMMLNTSLTVTHGCPNSHSNIWAPFTDNIIKFISDKCENIVFVLWGGNALSKLHLIDRIKHKVIISSHPSGLSCNNKLRTYPAFCNTNHFGRVNKYLEKHNKTPIIWQV